MKKSCICNYLLTTMALVTWAMSSLCVEGWIVPQPKYHNPQQLGTELGEKWGSSLFASADSQQSISRDQQQQQPRRSFLGWMTGMVGLSLSSKATPPAAAATVPGRTPSIGSKAPSFDLPNSRGDGTTSLQDLMNSGKWTVLYFYPGAFTSGCTLEAKSFQRDLDQYRQYNAQIVGVSVDPPEKNAQFCSSVGLDFFMLSDVGGRVSKLYGSALSIPGFGSFSNRQTYIIDPKGNVRWVFEDVESRIPRHSQEVLEKLQELTA